MGCATSVFHFSSSVIDTGFFIAPQLIVASYFFRHDKKARFPCFMSC